MRLSGVALLGAVLTLGAISAHGQPARPPAGTGIDLNSASRDELMVLDGIGEVRAEAIIRARPFKAKGELVERRLIPEALYDRIADKVTVRAAAAPAPAPPPAPAQKRR
ncbi:MAG: helix-hairpin-helix domain-containing protein [Enhydrobacter sp.]|nr:MAG: helix-hairpin-helix domain-containing protein [Enhydrobacter sp.]